MERRAIRRAIPEDAKTIAAFNAAMALETEGKELDLALVEAGVRGLFADRGRGFYLILEKDDAPAAQLMVTYEWSDWRNGVFWWIQSVYVKPQFRRQGLYRALYDHLKAEAEKAEDVCGIRLYVEHENLGAKKTYEALGMKAAHYAMYEVDFVL
jgi:ribosomal protein S18 acetylase RimI-like enzyme